MSPATTEASSRAQALQEMANMDVTLMGPFKLLEEHPELDPAGVLRSGLAKESADLFLALGAPESLAHARRWWTLGAAFDNDIAANCAYALAHILLVKRYTDSDANIEEGLRWLIKAADAAHRDACALLGKFYEQGMGPGNKTLIDRDYRRALDYYTRPCLYQRPQQEAEKKEANSSPVPTFKLQTHEAQYRVSIILKNGYGGIPIDPARSLEWCHKAACNLSVQAVYSMGMRMLPNLTHRAQAAGAGRALGGALVPSIHGGLCIAGSHTQRNV
ncbi:uncharacterized protein EV422DRAFT_89918 [Fimicolochytrium jonesii]|uniref:uncharacterized protein n=1 Tax=Fimicolochytrium jonesii TaxID=1396493 RepID=UPI0022FEF3CD|nr:uncharacterized protein EV422DRAFT_89918 [Fimicolochytrium jonesii]KAI8819880.1 hypothetical protein EV422DRAFT_89918 [Fimicolochytrium jonesii]